jgi:hypothetical protein
MTQKRRHSYDTLRSGYYLFCNRLLFIFKAQFVELFLMFLVVELYIIFYILLYLQIDFWNLASTFIVVF